MRQRKYRLMKQKETERRFVLITKTEERVYEDEDPKRYADLRKKAINNLRLSNREQCMKELGLTKVRGVVSGKTYWE